MEVDVICEVGLCLSVDGSLKESTLCVRLSPDSKEGTDQHIDQIVLTRSIENRATRCRTVTVTRPISSSPRSPESLLRRRALHLRKRVDSIGQFDQITGLICIEKLCISTSIDWTGVKGN